MNIETKPTAINKSVLESAYSYESYFALLNQLFEEGKTTGENHSEAMLNYAKMNLQRMNRLNKTVEISEELKIKISQTKTPQTWLVISEGWCGDAAQNLPAIAKMAALNSNINLKIILRDTNLEIIDQFLTNGGRSIPKLIVMNSESLEVIGTWGPRPEIAQEIVLEFKKIPDGDYPDLQKSLQLWYAKDKTNALQSEFAQLIQDWNSVSNK